MESRLRSRRGGQNDVFRTLSMNYLPSLDVDEEVEVFQEIGSKERGVEVNGEGFGEGREGEEVGK